MVETLQTKRMVGSFSLGFAQKIYLGFGSIIVLAAILGIVAVFSGQSSISYFTDYRSVARQNLVLASIQEDLLEARLSAYRYRATSEPAAAEMVASNIEEIIQGQEVARQIIVDEAMLRLVQDANALVALYKTTFAEAQQVEAQRASVLEAIRSVGPQTRKLLSEIMASAEKDGDAVAAYRAGVAQEHLMLARYYIAQFNSFDIESDAARAREELERSVTGIVDTLAELQNPTRRDLAERSMAGVRTLQETTDLLIETMAERRALYAELDRIGPEVDRLIDDGSEVSIARQDQIGPAAVSAINSSQMILMIGAALTVILGSVLALLIASPVSKAIRRLTVTMTQLADGDLERDIPGTKRSDELGSMARAVEVFKQAGLENRRLLADQEQQRQQAAKERAAEMAQFADIFEASVGKIVVTLQDNALQMRASAEKSSTVAEQTSAQSVNVATASEQASANVQTAAAASEEMARSLQEVSQLVQRAGTEAQEAVGVATNTNTVMQQLSGTADQVKGIVETITAIAAQTNLLALNATIEAARAGEAGRGFAVVANEVKSLAAQTQTATNQIAEQVEEIGAAVASTLNANDEITRMIDVMSGMSAEIAAAVEEQLTATSEIARNVQEAAQGTENVSSEITEVKTASEEAAQSATDVMTAAQSLNQDASDLDSEVRNFLNRVREAA